MPKGKLPPPRDHLVKETITRGWGSGHHKNKGQRGEGQRGKGKGQRHPKHKGQEHQERAASRSWLFTWPQDYAHLGRQGLALVGWLAQFAQNEGLEATNGPDALEMLAWDLGFQGEPLPRSASELGRIWKVDVQKAHRDGAKAKGKLASSPLDALEKMAFNQYNVPELLSQLKRLLPDETWDDLKAKGAIKLINDAWSAMSKKDRRSRR